MTRKLFVTAFTAAALAGGFGRAEAAPMTIATFSDPGVTPMFTFSAGAAVGTDPAGSHLTGGWADPGLDLVVFPGTGFEQTFLNVTFAISPSPLVATGGDADGAGLDFATFGAGDFTFFESDGITPILNFAWTGAGLTNGGFGSGLLLNDVNITAPAGSALFGTVFADPSVMNFTFATTSGALSLANTIGGGGPTGWTSSFTSSADVNVVPEPGSMLLLGSGLVGLGAAARRRMRKTAKA